MPYVPLRISAGVVAALSPRMPWEDNINSAAKVIAADKAGLSPEDVSVTAFHANKNKAFTIANMPWNADTSEVETILKGNKTKAFYRNLQGQDAVTVDGHATNIALGTMNSLDKTVGLTTKHYEYIESLYTELAESLCIKSYQLQAITWLTYRRLRGLS